MASHVALLRGINVGGRAKVPMAELRDIATSLCWQDVSTYLNSGNLFFTPPGSGPETELATQLTEALGARLRFAPPVLVRTKPELLRAARFCREAFPDAPDKATAIAFLSDEPAQPADDLLDGIEEGHHGDGRSVALHFPKGQGQSRLDAARLERLLGVTVTVRGILTVEALAQRLDER
ncbi:MAG: DUF1697 domain-containing protein [Thermomicrobiales bacterium]